MGRGGGRIEGGQGPGQERGADDRQCAPRCARAKDKAAGGGQKKRSFDLGSEACVAAVRQFGVCAIARSLQRSRRRLKNAGQKDRGGGCKKSARSSTVQWAVRRFRVCAIARSLQRSRRRLTGLENAGRGGGTGRRGQNVGSLPSTFSGPLWDGSRSNQGSAAASSRDRGFRSLYTAQRAEKKHRGGGRAQRKARGSSTVQGRLAAVSSVWRVSCDRSQLAAVASAAHGAQERTQEAGGGRRGQNAGLRGTRFETRFRIGKMRSGTRNRDPPWTRRLGAGSTTPFGRDRKRSVAGTMYSTGDLLPVKAPVTRGVTRARG